MSLRCVKLCMGSKNKNHLFEGDIVFFRVGRTTMIPLYVLAYCVCVRGGQNLGEHAYVILECSLIISFGNMSYICSPLI